MFMTEGVYAYKMLKYFSMSLKSQLEIYSSHKW